MDIINKNILIWSGDQGENISRNSLSECDKLYDEVQNLHNELVDKLAYLDDDLAEIVLKNNSLDNINVVSIYDALKRVTLSRVNIKSFKFYFERLLLNNNNIICF